MNIDESILDSFNDFIKKVAREEVQRVLKQYSIEEYQDVKVISVSDDNSTATVRDMVTNETFSDIPNRTGDTLEVDNIVRIYKASGNYQSEYIGLNFGEG